MITAQQNREIIRLKESTTFSSRHIARNLNIHHTTVSNTLKKLNKLGLSYQVIEKITDSQLLVLLHPIKTKMRKRLPDWSHIHQLMQAKHQTLFELWISYFEADPEMSYHYSRFHQLYQLFISQTTVSMRQHYNAGEYCFVDYAGLLIPYYDGEEKKLKYAQIFVGVLGASRYVFVYASPSQKLDDWLDAHNKMYQFFGGVSMITVPDNLRSAVTKSGKELILNQSYQALAKHYNTVIEPARVRKPQDKSQAEQSVLIASRWITAVLRRRSFFSVMEINEAIKPLLEKLNKKTFKQYEGCRESWFKEFEQSALKPLPDTPYEIATWLPSKTVPSDYHLVYKGHAYSVPYQLVGEKITCCISKLNIEVFNDNVRVAVHPLSTQQGGATTLAAHRPASHYQFSQLNLTELTKWAENVGENTLAVIRLQFEGKPQSSIYARKACSKLQVIAKNYGVERFEQACLRALTIKSPSVKSIESILAHNLEQPSAELTEQFDIPLGFHQNHRGANYFG